MKWDIDNEATSDYDFEEQINLMYGVALISHHYLFRAFRQHFSFHWIKLQ